MPDADFASARLFVEADLAPDGIVPLDRDQQNYLGNVLRLRPGQGLLVFNGRQGAVSGEGKKIALQIGARVRGQPPAPSLRWLFAPLKHARLDYMVQKAVELGVGSVEPVLTRRTQVSRVNLERMRSNIVEAAEQCGVLAVPDLVAERPLDRALDHLPSGTVLVFCDERAPVADPLAALQAIPPGPVAVLIGPEGGFEEAERARLLAVPGAVRIALGPRILRADTAAVAALTLVQAVRGDWRG
jgi:16S rRNA (uracil1498-N3)-methyltransferase